MMSAAPTEFTVTLICRDLSVEITVPAPTTQLRYLQQQICRAFGQGFPVMAATLTIGEEVYDDFGHVPFAAGPPCGPCIVAFVQSSDMFWYDYRDRKGDKRTLAEEVEEEQHSARVALPAVDGIQPLA